MSSYRVQNDAYSLPSKHNGYPRDWSLWQSTVLINDSECGKAAFRLVRSTPCFAASAALPPVLVADMDTPRSDKTHVEAELSYADKASKYAGPLSAATSVAPSIYEKGGAVAAETEMLDVPPDGGRGWVVIFGCIIFSAATVGWGYVLVSCCAISQMS